MADFFERPASLPPSRGLWVRYGGQAVTEEQLQAAAKLYSVALLQPSQRAAAARLKELNPGMVVLCYKCFSSTRKYEVQGPFTSGISYAEAEQAEAQGHRWFSRRLTGERIEWEGYPGHFQMNVWEPSYRARWVENVSRELDGSAFDGVMADNDIFDDYYGLNLPIRGAQQMGTLHRGLDQLVEQAGKALNSRGKILVPNIAESRRAPGKWERHSAFGGGFEEVFLGWGAESYLDTATALAQLREMVGPFPPVQLGGQKQMPRLTLLRASTDGSESHPNFLAAVAAFWVFGAGRWTALSAGAHDAHNDLPWIEELSWDLGSPLGGPVHHKGIWSRHFSRGWAAVNLMSFQSAPLAVNDVYTDLAGELPGDVVIPAHQGVILRR